MPAAYSATITRVQKWADNLKSIYLKFDGKRMPFEAGQHVMLSASIGGKKECRAYSISSAPQDDEIEIIFRVIGTFTKFLDSLKEGDVLQVTGPFGHFTLKLARQKNLIFIAAGTGISPFLAMIADAHNCGRCAQFGSITVLYGTKYEDMLVHRKELELHEKACKNFRFIPVLSREEKWGGRKGHVQAYLDEIMVEDADYFICGLPEMVDDVEKILLEKGVKKENIHLERY